MTVVQAYNITKTYGGKPAVESFSLKADKGELVALVGPDGAGKTTLFRCLCGLLEIDRGEIMLAGFDIKKEFDHIKPLMGYMPQNFSLYPDLSVEENLDFYAGLFDIRGDNLKTKKARLYEFSGLGPFAKRRAGRLSGGMKQKLALSCNLIHDPEILILDEPTTGVDPVSRRQFWEILKNLKTSGSTIIVSTPYMDEVALADRAIFMYRGKAMTEGTPAQLAAQFRGKVFRADILPSPEDMRRLNDIKGISSRRFGSTVHVYIGTAENIENLRQPLSGVGIDIDKISPVPPDLEDTFIQFMEQ